MIATSSLGSWFGTCVHRKAIREFWFIQNSARRDSVFCSTHERHQAARLPGFVIRGLLTLLAAFAALPGSGVVSGPAYSQALVSGPTEAGEVSIVQMTAGPTWHSIGRRPVIAPPHPRPETTSALTRMAEQVAVAHTLPIGYFLRLIRQESGFNPNSISPTGAQGIAQFMPATASERGLQDPFDPAQALPKSAELLNELRDKFGNFGLAAAAYNAGTDRVHKWLAGKGQLPQETIDYVRVITGHDAADWAKSNDLVLLQNFDAPASLSRPRVSGTSWEAQLLATLQAAPVDPSSGSPTSTSAPPAIITPAKTGKIPSEAALCPHCILQPGY